MFYPPPRPLLHYPAIRRFAAVLLAATLLGCLTASLSAQPAPAAGPVLKDPVQLDRLVVTGSNIQRLDMEKVAPVMVLDQTAIDVRGGLLPVDLLTSLPSEIGRAHV